MASNFTSNPNIFIPPQQNPASQPHSLLYQREEVVQTCCFVNSITHNRDSTPSTKKEYAHSLTAKSKEKKINLLITKKGVSVQKTVGISLSKNLVGNSSRSCKIITAKVERTNVATTLGSKEVTQKNSLCNSRTRPEQMLKIEYNQAIRQVQGPPPQAYPLKPASEVTFPNAHTRDVSNMSNMHMLSDITLVEEQFISHGSTTLNALNYLSNYNTEKSKFCEQANSTIKLISNYPLRQDSIKQLRNPLEKLIERRNGAERKRLML